MTTTRSTPVSASASTQPGSATPSPASFRQWASPRVVGGVDSPPQHAADHRRRGAAGRDARQLGVGAGQRHGQPEAVCEAHDACAVGGRKLADALAQDGARSHADALPQGGHGGLHREASGALQRRTVDALACVTLTKQRIKQRRPARFSDQPIARVEHGADDGLRLVEGLRRAPHCQSSLVYTNAVLAGDRSPSLPSDASECASRPKAARRSAASLNASPVRCSKWLRPVPAVQAASARTHATSSPDSAEASISSSHSRYFPASSDRVAADLVDSGSTLTGRSARSPSVTSASSTSAGGRDGHRLLRTHRPVSTCTDVHAVGRFAVALQHHVGVRAGEAKGVHRRQRSPTVARWPRRLLRGNTYGHPVPVEVGVRLLEVKVSGDNPFVHGQHRLHDAGHACRPLGVPDVGLYRAHQQRPLDLSPAPVDRGEGTQFNGVAQVPCPSRGPPCSRPPTDRHPHGPAHPP